MSSVVIIMARILCYRKDDAHDPMILFYPNFGVFPLDQIADVEVNVRRYLKLFGREIIFEVFQPM